MKSSFILSLVLCLEVLLGTSSAYASSAQAAEVVGVSSGSLGSPIDGLNGKIYLADASNNRLIVVTATTDAVTTISLPGQPQTQGGSLSRSKDGALLAVPLKNSNISIVDLAADTVVATFSTAAHTPLSTAFGSSNSKIFFSTTATFDEVYLLDTELADVTVSFGVNADLSWTGTDMQLETNAAGDTLYILERFGSPGRLHKLSVATPESPTFIAEDSHGTLGSNCRGFAVLPDGVATPSSGDEAYLACGHPYYVQGIKQVGAVLIPNTEFDTEEYPLAVDVLANGKVVAVRDASTGYGVRIFSNSGIEEKGWEDGGGLFPITADGAVGTLVGEEAKVYTTNCGYNSSLPTNCKLWAMGGPAPSLTITADKIKFTKKGGALKVSASIVGAPVANVSAKLKKGIQIIKSASLATTINEGNYTGTVSIPKNGTKKNIKYTVYVTASVEGKIMTSNSVSVTVTNKNK